MIHLCHDNTGPFLVRPFAGLDSVVKYEWNCNLDDKPGRYDCPINVGVEVISSSSITRRETYTILPPQNGIVNSR
jgi:hypothetical protein